MAHPILLYDGVCGLCNRLVQFVLRRDHNAEFKFASLQSAVANRILSHHAVNPGDLDTVYVVLNHELEDERLLSRSDAVVFVLKALGAPWRAAAWPMRLLPRFLRDFCYNLIARSRYRIFGRFEVCTLPCDADRSRFLDL
jgi:predicted DCC family thiol-disulfide oxidoreductase YuxK